MLADVLKQAGIDARVFGQALSGGMGELPAQGLVRVMVESGRLEEAREIVAQWQQQTPDDEALERAVLADMAATAEQPDSGDSKRRPDRWQDAFFLVLLVLIGALVARLILR